MKGNPHISWVTCAPCGKRAYATRKDARKMKANTDLHPYRCPVNDEQFHLGHLQGDVLRGHVARDDYYGPNGVGRIRHTRGNAARWRDTQGDLAA
ncbi:hypothetical protein [Rhodococcus opacus]|uniref:hypothetical protein n=1 Tax=Rhodococcus opacus TaxID=37919 RepID=UPI001C47126C|nr:hypothetical protein [Rhodococcus opacus]MBV6758415.1 hypothetical protein [Rhodococcus opacus]